MQVTASWTAKLTSLVYRETALVRNTASLTAMGTAHELTSCQEYNHMGSG